MKYSQTIGIIAAIGILIISFLPWSFIPSVHLEISGMQTTGTDFGKPALLNMILSCLAIVFFAIPTIWAKRWNVLFTAINIAWAVRNFILVSTCIFGDCPQVKPALYLLLVFAGIILLMSLLPRLNNLKEKK